MSGIKRDLEQSRKSLHECVCGYNSFDTSNMKKHKTKHCKYIQSSDLIASLKNQIEEMKAQLAAKDADMKAQLAAKDKQIMALAKRPTKIENNIQIINCFGQESTDHITAQQIQNIIRNPDSAVSELIKLKYKARENKNICVPNKKQPIYKVLVTNANGEKEWVLQPKQEVLEKMYDINSGYLECEADEDTREGSRFLTYQDKMRDSEYNDRKLYNRCLKQIDCVVMSIPK